MFNKKEIQTKEYKLIPISKDRFKIEVAAFKFGKEHLFTLLVDAGFLGVIFLP